MKLPEAFTDRMSHMLGPEYADFIASYDQPRNYGLRVNTLKLSPDEFAAISPFKLEPVPWAAEGFYISDEDRPAKHPYYHAGLYYIQEPSAMTTVSVLEPKPGDRVLDLCAAPGGKSTQIAARLANKGVLVTNDVNSQRIIALVRNLEMFGAKNYCILNELPSRLAERFAGYFDKIVIDAPCSGEGMFRKDPFAVKSWGEFSVEKCVTMQKGILKHVSAMLKPGGYIVYSTCTFAPEENEARIEELIKKYPELEIADITAYPGFENGQPQWAEGEQSLRKTVRLWPHKVKGEGHFVALLRKKDGPDCNIREYTPNPPSYSEVSDFCDFIEDTLNVPPQEFFENGLFQNHSRLYVSPLGLPVLDGLKVIRPGWYLGELKKNRFKPVTTMALALKKQDAKRILDFSSSSEEVIRYLKGETLNITGERGWNLVCVDGYPLGWAKQLKDMLNNYYPAGWRWLD